VSARVAEDPATSSETLRDDGNFVLTRRRNDRASLLSLSVAARHPARGLIKRLQHEYALREELDSTWAARPTDLSEEDGGPAVMSLEDPGGQLASGLVGQPLDIAVLLRVAIGAAASVGRAHERGLVHRDLKPANILTDAVTGRAWLLGFGLASRLPRERRPLDPPQMIEGTLAYMAPEQTGRMNRSVDTRSDLYSLGVTLYELFTGRLPFEASDAMGWLHCHLAQTAPRADRRRKDLAEPLGSILDKLLAKAPENRYQTAAGLESDLRHCLDSIERCGRIEAFTLGSADVPVGLVIPERLYGREREIDVLVAAFERVVGTGELEVVLVSGHSGIGKSSVVYELHKALVPPRGQFAAGKFDQYRRDIPYATLAEAFGSLMRTILAESEAELFLWRAVILEALGPNGRLVTDLIPELELVIGPQPPVPELPPGDAENRFQMVFTQLIGAFARPEHPLALFLDDLQWLDAATLKLMERLVVKRERMHLLLVGAYRSNEVPAAHPLALAIDAMRRAATPLHEVRLSALSPEDVGHLVADALRVDASRATPLAALVWEKTQGSPFFTIEFLTELAHERLLTRDGVDRSWSWDRGRILTKGYTDNVVDLMATKIERLAPRTQEVLKRLACLGSSASGATLALVSDVPFASIDDALWDPVRLGLVRRSGDSYIFVHDRVMEAAYLLIPEQSRSDVHLHIGRTLRSELGSDAPADEVFDVVNQLNRAVALINDVSERSALCRLNVLAGRKARAAVAYQSARNYFAQAAVLLPREAWAASYRDTFDLHLHLSECEYLAGHFERADALFDELLAHAGSKFDRAEVYTLRMKLYQVAGKYDAGVTVALEALALFGVTFPETESDIAAASAEELRATPENLGGRQPSELATAPEAEDPAVRTIINLLVGSIPCAYIGRPHICPLLMQKAVNYSLRYGNTEESPFAYGVYALMVVSIVEDIPRAYEFSTMSLRLNERFGNVRLEGTLLHLHADHVLFWRRHFAEGVPILRRAFTACQEVGDLVYAGFLAFETVWQFIERGDALDDVLAQSRPYEEFAQRSNNIAVCETIRLEQQFVASLQGKTVGPLGMQDARFDEEASFAVVVNATFGCGIVFYHIMKLVLAFLQGQYTEALAAARRAEPVLGAAMAMPIEATYYVFRALTLIALLPSASPEERDEFATFLAGARKKIANWAENCPENFGSRHALVSAEVARLEGRDLEAMRLYEDAIQSARAHGFVQHEALALELAAQFYDARGFETTARAHLREACDRYARWGAHAKVRQLERLHPHLRAGDAPIPPTATIGASVEELDLATVVRTMQVLTSEIVLEKWTARALTIAVEDAGARRGVLLVLSDGQLRGLAEANLTTSGVEVRMLEAPALVPQTLLRYVERTHEAIVLDDASTSEFAKDPYIAAGQSRSILCLPLAKQDALRGVLYLENDLAPCAFTARTTALLKLLASQAALSLENVWLHSDLQRENDTRRRTEAALRRSEMFLAEAQRLSRTGSFAWVPSTGEIEFSDESYRITGIQPATRPTLDDIIARMHQEDAPQVREILLRATQTGEALGYEHRYVMPDGAARFVRIIAQSFREPGAPVEYVGAITDITERREAEAALQNAQAELARVMRVSALGELAASIAHEVSQPLAAIAADATAALNWLGFDPPNIEGTREALEAIDADCQRAGDVLSRINALLKRAPLERTTCDLNAIVSGVVPLVKPQFEIKGVALETELEQQPLRILGDAVQLQQVLINLLLNAADACRSLETSRRRVVVRTTTERRGGQAWFVVSVADTGKGIQPEVRARIFDAFYTTKSDGLGMGLSISRTIVQRHDGELSVSPNRPNGATFAVRLPSLS
jgi:predicted ATPase/signal transduction histidine kinase